MIVLSIMSTERFITIGRRVTQAGFILLILLIPVFDIFRYDTATKELIVCGSAWTLGLKAGFQTDHSAVGALHIALRFFLKGILPWVTLLSLFPLLGFFTGRLFCGWLCPGGTFFELANFFTLRLSGRRSLYGKKPNDPEVPGTNRFLFGTLALLSMIVVPLLGGVALTGYLINPRTIWHQIFTGDFTFGVKAGITGVSVFILVMSLFVRHIFCKFVCGPGLLQAFFGWISPVSLRLKMDTSRIAECTNCRGCEKACFMNILPRKNKWDISCVTCGDCIAACHRELGEGKGLFRFQRGEK